MSNYACTCTCTCIHVLSLSCDYHVTPVFPSTRNKYFIDDGIHSNSLAVIKTRAKFLNIDIMVGSFKDFVLTDDVCGVMLQYPNNDGIINNYNDIIQQAKGLKVKIHVHV